MNKKQKNIYRHIIKNFNLPRKNHFIQYRNLKEFRNFEIERINPTHKILLYGKLKNKKCNSLIRVGEIIINGLTITLNYKIILSNIDLICIIINMFFLSSIIFYVMNRVNIWREFYAYWYRGFSWRWQNYLYG